MSAKICSSVLHLSFVLLLLLSQTSILCLADETTSQVILAKANGLSLLNLSSLVEVDLISRDSILYSADFFVRRDGLTQLFWSDIKHETIQSALLINSTLKNLTLLDLKDAWEIENVAVDWLAGNLYWVVKSRGRIDVAKTDGSNHCTVVTNIARPRALALDPEEGLMFWSDWSDVSPRIERSTLAGSDRKLIYKVDDKEKYGWLNAITLDRAKKLIYWIDAKSHTVHVSNYDGGDHRILLNESSFLSRPFSLDLINSKLIWPEFYTKAIIQGDINDNPLTPEIIYESNDVMFGVKSLSSIQRQPIWEEECVLAAGGKCSHLCLHHKVGVDRCVCPFGMTLTKDERTCFTQRTILALVSQPKMQKKVIYYKDPKEPMLALSTIILKKASDILSVSYAQPRNLLAWLDNFDSKIYFQSPNQNGSFSVPQHTTAITVATHSYAQYVYIAIGGEFPSIAECSFITFVCVPFVLENVYKPSNLVFIDKNLIWLDSLKGREFIERYSLQTLKRETVYTGSNICCVTADTVTKNIYWLEKNILSSLRLENNEITQIDIDLETSSTLLSVVNGVAFMKGKDLVLREYNLNTKNWIFVSTAKENITAVVPIEIPDAEEEDLIAYDDFEAVNEVSSEPLLQNFDEKCDCVNGFCIDVKEGLVCVCNEGYKGKRCEISACDGYCIHGQCKLHDGNPVCNCFDNYFGEKCESVVHIPCSQDPCKESEKRFHDLHSQFRALFFVSVPVIACLTLTTIGLFLLWIRTRHLLQTAVGVTDREKTDVKRPWRGLVFVPSLLKTTEDKKALIDDEFNLTNSHV